MASSRSVIPKERRDILSLTSQKLPPYMTKDEVRTVLDGIESKPLYHLLINFLWQTGARVTEALSVKVSDIDFYSKAVHMPSLKNKAPR